MNMPMRMLRSEGGSLPMLGQSVAHFARMSTTRYPKIARKKTISGTNPNQIDLQFLVSRWLRRERQMPRAICATPKTIDTFILYELKKDILLDAKCHAGSTPNG